jgi:hypothetical protein
VSTGSGMHRATGGMRARQRETTELVAEAIRRYDDVVTDADLRSVLEWSRHHDFYLRTANEVAAMRAAYDRAHSRIAAPVTEAPGA